MAYQPEPTWEELLPKQVEVTEARFPTERENFVTWYCENTKRGKDLKRRLNRRQFSAYLQDMVFTNELGEKVQRYNRYEARRAVFGPTRRESGGGTRTH